MGRNEIAECRGAVFIWMGRSQVLIASWFPWKANERGREKGGQVGDNSNSSWLVLHASQIQAEGEAEVKGPTDFK